MIKRVITTIEQRHDFYENNYYFVNYEILLL